MDNCIGRMNQEMTQFVGMMRLVNGPPLCR
jgi:hypothetical protein